MLPFDIVSSGWMREMILYFFWSPNDGGVGSFNNFSIYMWNSVHALIVVITKSLRHTSENEKLLGKIITFFLAGAKNHTCLCFSTRSRHKKVHFVKMKIDFFFFARWEIFCLFSLFIGGCFHPRQTNFSSDKHAKVHFIYFHGQTFVWVKKKCYKFTSNAKCRWENIFFFLKIIPNIYSTRFRKSSIFFSNTRKISSLL